MNVDVAKFRSRGNLVNSTDKLNNNSACCLIRLGQLLKAKRDSDRASPVLF